MSVRITFFCGLLSLLAASCSTSGSKATCSDACGTILTSHAELLTLANCDSFTLARIVNPWDTTSILAEYALIDRNRPQPGNIPSGATIVRVPLQQSIIYSGVHGRAIAELGGLEAIKGVADGAYFTMPQIQEALADGNITDVGPATSPSLERLIEVNPDAIVMSPYQNAGHGIIDQTGAAIIEMADYMEPTPLGRAEWIKLLGALYGNATMADSIFNATVAEYTDLCGKAAVTDARPSVVTQKVESGVWYVPGGCSYQARLLADAGARYPWANDTSSGSLGLDFAAVYDRAHDADFWLTTTYGPDLTLDALRQEYPLNAEMSAYAHGGVYNANTASTTYFDDFPFHPEVLLREYIAIFHPELMPGYQLRYYRKVQ